MSAWSRNFPGSRVVRAFSSEVDTGSREENASKNERLEPGSDSIRIDKALV
jgi:hypothetical protein